VRSGCGRLAFGWWSAGDQRERWAGVGRWPGADPIGGGRALGHERARAGAPWPKSEAAMRLPIVKTPFGGSFL